MIFPFIPSLVVTSCLYTQNETLGIPYIYLLYGRPDEATPPLILYDPIVADFLGPSYTVGFHANGTTIPLQFLELRDVRRWWRGAR